MSRIIKRAASLSAVALLAAGSALLAQESPSPSPSMPSPTSSAGLSCPLTSPFPSNLVEVHIPAGAMNLGSSAFGQNPLSVAPGTVVIWVNDDTMAHTITSDSGVFDSGSLAPGTAFAYTFKSSGSFPYHCSIHPSMTGVVSVGAAGSTPTPSPTDTSAAGSGGGSTDGSNY